jgi:hypothetical protein
MARMGTEESNLPAEGWYEDPDGVSGRRRYWDGKQWTNRYTTSKAPTRVDEIDRRFRSLFTLAKVLHALGWVTIVLGGLIVVFGAIAAGSSDSETTRNAFGELQRNDPGASAALIAVGGSLAVALYALAFFGAAALVRLALRVEDNSFRTAAAVERLADRPPA